MPVSLLHPALKRKVIRHVPEGLCRNCDGTGNGGDVPELGDYRSEPPVKECKSCAGSGMAAAKTGITTLGVALLFAIGAAIWAFPLISMSSLAAIGITEAMLRRGGPDTERKTVAPVVKQTILPDPAGVPTEGVLSLFDAIESSRQTADQPDVTRSARD